ncbi:hypothetical protein PVAP13_2KG263558 [Panicum virgatum]|uniref:Uncharacterized protein n=1 Tax=Panicum virgatum TaxID=38727 RepID=A0A8T0VYS6_PANVG|nr:hypothetical protein PVAP13_2KG263558 [Panicum virgatum]
MAGWRRMRCASRPGDPGGVRARGGGEQARAEAARGVRRRRRTERPRRRGAKTLGLVHTKAKARVSTTPAGTTSVNLHARTPNSAATSSVTISIKAGSASAQCSAQEPVKKQQCQNASTSKLPMLLLPPWDSAKLW